MDEIGDLVPNLQSKLLLVLSGAEVFRLGAEGNHEYGFIFNGVTIAATWRDVTKLVRSDLLSRLSDYELTMPSLEERIDDFPLLAPLVAAEINRSADLRASRLKGVTHINQSTHQFLAARRLTLTEADITALARHPWSRTGELRGLRQALQRMFRGLRVQEALELQPCCVAEPASVSVDELARGVAALLEPGGTPAGFAKCVKRVEHRIRESIVELLTTDSAELVRVAQRLKLSPDRLRAQLSDLKRIRQRQSRPD